MSSPQMDLEKLFSQVGLLQKALTHKSYANEHRMGSEHNEKLEFLGDAVLDLVVGEFLYEKFPTDTEGNLSKKRASVVNEEVLSAMAVRLHLHERLQLGKGEALTGGAHKPRLLASAFEALVGALFLDQGFSGARDFVRSRFSDQVDELGQQVDYEKDYKTRLQEIAQKSLKETPVYVLLSEEGPPHERVFKVAVQIKSEVLAEGHGKSKKSAEQAAAEEALKNYFKEKV